MKRSITAILLALALLTAFAACGNSTEAEPTTQGSLTHTASPDPAPALLPDVGEGSKLVTLLVTLSDGTETLQNVRSDKATLGEALRDAGVIECDDSGYVTTVNGIALEWDRDQAYWAFYVDGQMAMHGVNDEQIDAPKTYELRYTKG